MGAHQTRDELNALLAAANLPGGRTARELFELCGSHYSDVQAFRLRLRRLVKQGLMARKLGKDGVLRWPALVATAPDRKGPKRAPKLRSHIVIPPHHMSVRAQPALPAGSVEIPEHLIQRHPGFAYAPLVPERDHSLHARPGSATFKSIPSKGF